MGHDLISEFAPRIPRFHETEGIPVEEKLIYLHFFLTDSHWYVAEFDGRDTFFGYVILAGDQQNAEWGYFSLSELKEVQIGPLCVIEDCSWEVKRFGEIQIGNNLV